MPTSNRPSRPNQQQIGLGTRLLSRMGDWADDRVADAKGAALDMATQFQPVANAISELPPPLGLHDGGAPVYAERGRTDAKGQLVHFANSKKEWANLKARFIRERLQAQDLLTAEH